MHIQENMAFHGTKLHLTFVCFCVILKSEYELAVHGIRGFRQALPAEKDHTYRFRLDAGGTIENDRDSLRISFGAYSRLNSAERSRWDTDICVVKASKETVTIEHKDQSGKKESGDE